MNTYSRFLTRFSGWLSLFLILWPGLNLVSAQTGRPDRNVTRPLHAGTISRIIHPGDGAGKTKEDVSLVVDDGDEQADTFFGFADGSPFFWGNRFQVSGYDFALQSFDFFLQTSDVAAPEVYLAILDGSGAVVDEGSFTLDRAPAGGWFTLTLDGTIDFDDGERFYLEVGTLNGGIAYPAGMDTGILPASAQPIAYYSETGDGTLAPASGDFLRDVFLIRAHGSRIVPNQAPSISHSAPGQANAGADLAVSATVTDNSAVSRVELVYFQGGSESSRSLVMNGSGNNYQATIPAADVTSRGVEYYLKATDDQDEVSYSPLYIIRVRVEQDGLSRAVAAGNDTYRLVSFPIDLDNKSGASVLEDDLGGYDHARWRFFGLNNNQTYSEYPSTGNLAPGRAFWLAVRETGKQFDSGAGTSVSTGQPFEIALNAGWNFVGTPFNFEVPQQYLYTGSGRSLDIRSYGNNWTSYTGAFKPFEGYAVFSPEADRLLVYPNFSPEKRSFRMRTHQSRLDWSIRIDAISAYAKDDDNVAGTAEEAESDWDQHDLAEPPPIGDFVSLYFDRGERRMPIDRLQRDVRATGMKEMNWPLSLETARNEPITLRFQGIAGMPEDLDVILVDRLTGDVINLRERASFQVSGTGRGNIRSYELKVGQNLVDQGTEIPGRFELTGYPNPFNPSTTIRYGLPEAGTVTVELFDVLGKRINRLVSSNRQESGYHSVVWDGTDGAGRSVASGVYVCRIQAGVYTKQLTLVLAK